MTSLERLPAIAAIFGRIARAEEFGDKTIVHEAPNDKLRRTIRLHRIREDRLVSKEQVDVLNGKIDAVRALLFNLDRKYAERPSHQEEATSGLIAEELVETRYSDTIWPFDIAADKEAPGTEAFFPRDRLFFQVDGEDGITFSCDFDNNFELIIEERENKEREPRGYSVNGTLDITDPTKEGPMTVEEFDIITHYLDAYYELASDPANRKPSA